MDKKRLSEEEIKLRYITPASLRIISLTDFIKLLRLTILLKTF